MSGKLHGPFPFVAHYAGLKKNRQKLQWHYLSKKALEAHENHRIRALLAAWAPLEKQHAESIAGQLEKKLGRRRRKSTVHQLAGESLSDYIKRIVESKSETAAP